MATAYQEVRTFEVGELLRLWLRGDGQRRSLTTNFIGAVVEAVCPHRVDGRGHGWRLLVANHNQIEAWLKNDGPTVVKSGLLGLRRGGGLARPPSSGQ